MTRPLPIACLALALALPSFHAAAQTPPAEAPAAQPAAAPAAASAAGPTALQGDAERGRSLTYTCQGCHGIANYKNAYPSFRVPKIGGQSFEYLSNSLHAYKQGTREHPTMQAQSQSFSDQDIADISAFLSGLTTK